MAKTESDTPIIYILIEKIWRSNWQNLQVGKSAPTIPAGLSISDTFARERKEAAMAIDVLKVTSVDPLTESKGRCQFGGSAGTNSTLFAWFDGVLFEDFRDRFIDERSHLLGIRLRIAGRLHHKDILYDSAKDAKTVLCFNEVDQQCSLGHIHQCGRVTITAPASIILIIPGRPDPL